ncbi:MAG: hypothetical protein OXN83_00115 [Oligoflexia bacterium]|nr:hypothetical protein [Oligoflexia bacterium]
MLNLIIGGRGTGKTHFLTILQAYYKKQNLKAQFFDLDQEIEKATGQTVFELFKKGESHFRRWEQKIFKQIVSSLTKNTTCFLSAGAGFKFKKSADWNVIYLFRESDKMGRIFLNRPPLTNKAPLKEYKNYYKNRTPYYIQQADEHLFRREYFKTLESSDLLFLGLKKIKPKSFTLTLYPKLLPKNKKKLKAYLEKRLLWGIRFFEINDQHCSFDFIKQIQTLIPADRILFSSQVSKKFLKISNKIHWSWDISLGPPPQGVTILSLHKRGKTHLKSLLKNLSKYKNYHLKLAIEIFNLKELEIASHWQKEDPKNRSFLPRSKEGRWLWFRQVFGPQMPLHFIKEHDLSFTQYQKTEILDQPFLSQAIPFIKKFKALAGILADPVKNLATPFEQNHFFYKQNSIPVLALSLKEKEMTKQNLKTLNRFGFIFFAISSPLKHKAFSCSDKKDKVAKNFKTSNTLIFQNKIWQAFNTDWNGLQKLKVFSSNQTVVWGGGGIKPVLKKALPLAQFYSARKAQPLNKKNSAKNFSPKTLIWAVGRKRMESACQWPPKHFKPAQVIDINYTEDSPGLEYALKVKADYTSGLVYFKEQAQKQRELFKKLYKL